MSYVISTIHMKSPKVALKRSEQNIEKYQQMTTAKMLDKLRPELNLNFDKTARYSERAQKFITPSSHFKFANYRKEVINIIGEYCPFKYGIAKYLPIKAEKSLAEGIEDIKQTLRPLMVDYNINALQHLRIELDPMYVEFYTSDAVKQIEHLVAKYHTLTVRHDLYYPYIQQEFTIGDEWDEYTIKYGMRDVSLSKRALKHAQKINRAE